MTVSLLYDDTISRVRITATGLAVTDAFGRTVANGWGTADSGHPWTNTGGAAADYSVTGGRGRHSMNTQNVARFTVADSGIADVDFTALVWPSVTSLTQPIDAGIVARFADTNNHLLLRCRFDTSGNVDLELFAIGSGGPALASAFNVSTYTPAGSLFLRFQVIGSTLRGKVWFGTEPSTWAVEATYTGAPFSGRVGFRSNVITGNTNTSPVVEYDLVSAVRTVDFVRSTDQVDWTPVRGGLGRSDSDGSIALDDFEFSPDVTNHYLVGGLGGLRLPNASGSYASTPDNAVLDITGDIDIRVDATLDDWNIPSVFQSLASKWVSAVGGRSWVVQIRDDGSLGLTWSTDGTASVFLASTVDPVPDPVTRRLAVRVTLDVDDGGGHTARFYTAPSLAGPWTALGNPVSAAGITSLFSANASLAVGAHSDGTSGTFGGTVHAAEVRAGIDGTVVANPVFHLQADGTTGFTDDAGRVWTVIGTARIDGTQFGYGPPLNTNTGFEVDTSGWAGQNATIARSTAQAHAGVASLLITPDGVSGSGGAIADGLVPVTPGQAVKVSLWAYSPAGWSDLRPLVDWHGPGGFFVSSALGTGFAVPAATWTYLEQIFTVPTGVAFAKTRARHGGTPTAGDIWYADEIELRPLGITPVLGSVWLKSLSNPALNREVTPWDAPRAGRPSRTGVFDIKGAKFPVAVTDVPGSHGWPLRLRADSAAEADAINAILDDGSVLFVHAPTTGRLSVVRTAYVVMVGETEEEFLPTLDLQTRVITLPFREVAAPAPEVVGVSVP